MNLSMGFVYLLIVAFIILLVIKVGGLIFRVVLVAILLALVFSIFKFDLMDFNIQDKIEDVTENGLTDSLVNADCLSKNGKIINGECQFTYEDAGLSCYDSSHCKGYCLAEFSNGNYIGKCQSDSILPDTFNVMEDGEVKEVKKGEELSGLKL
ncbi:MAG: hypothetical protein PHE43_02560 [Candidatus Nanoarchaeia archaeon]|nr:hypothetical protein [Candidatus Nanoarchaeia archaeon]